MDIKPMEDEYKRLRYIIFNDEGEKIGFASYNHFYYWGTRDQGAWMVRIGKSEFPLVYRRFEDILPSVEQLNVC